MDRIHMEFLRRGMALALCMALLSSQAAPVFAASEPDVGEDPSAVATTQPEEAGTPTPALESDPPAGESAPAEDGEAAPSPSSEPVASALPDESAAPAESVQPSESGEAAETAQPTESPAPEESGAPAESEVPVETAEPAGGEGGYQSPGPLTDGQISLFASVGDPIDPDNVVPPDDYRAYYYSIGFGIPGVLQNDTYSLEDYDYFYAVEAEDTAGYGVRKYSDSPSSVGLDKVTNPDAQDNPNAYPGVRAIPYTTVAYSGSGSFVKTNAFSFCVLPGQSILGRVPDQTFEGWYLYPFGTKPENNSNTLQSPALWLFGDDVSGDEMIPVDVQPYNEATSPNKDYYEYYKTHGDTWDGGADYGEYGYTVIPNTRFTAWTPDRNNPVSLVGKWGPSTNSKARDLVDENGQVTQPGMALTVKTGKGTVKTAPSLYTDAIAGRSLDSLTPTKFDPAVTEYWLRVDADVTTVDLALNAYEPYYAYNVEGTGECPVSVTAAFGGVDTYDSALAQGDQALSGKALPEATLNGSNNIPQNNLTDPAHSHWTVEGIDLSASDGANGNYYNDLRITITAPAGLGETNTGYKTTYLFHIQRMAEPTLEQNPGNTPLGMIRRDTAAVWGETTADIAANKATATEFFENNLHFGERLTPQDSVRNNNGSIYRGVYGAGAWSAYVDKVTGKTRNIDLDPTAIVVYQDSAFLDPGVTMTDSQGNAVNIAESGSVKRSLKLSGTSELGLESMRNGAERWYIDGELYENRSGSYWNANGVLLDPQKALVDADGSLWETLKQTGGTDQIDLRGMNVLPGIYTLEYRLDDPVSDRSYRSVASVVDTGGQTGFLDPDHTDNALTFSRTLVVLPIPGDVDMDGAVTAADAAELRRKLSMSSGTGNVITIDGLDVSSDSVAALMAYRVCDLNGDGVLDMDDLSELEKIPEPQLRSAGDVTASDYRYLPLPTGEGSTYRPRVPLTDETGEGKAKLSIRYLGQERARRQNSGVYVGSNSEIGPWNADESASIELGDTFWVGVYLNDGNLSDLLNQSVAAFSLSLTYDEQYLEPAVVLTSAQLSEAAQANSDTWEWMMGVYNMGARSQTVWGTRAQYAVTGATGYGRDFTTHYSKAITSLEANQTSNTRLKELVFSLERQTGDLAVLSSGEELCLMVVPFRLKSHPFGMDGKSVRMVELGAGMSEFSIVSTSYGIGGSGRAAAFGISQPLDMAGLFAAGSQGGVSPVAAYSMYPIFGQFTANLRDHIAYTKVGVDVPLGSDKSEVTELYNELAANNGPAVYSTEFIATAQNQGIPVDAAAADIIDLPSFLQYTAGRLSGTPTKAGTYDFYIRGIHYRLKVEKAPLYYWADQKYSYYGQTEYRGEPNSPDRGNKENYNFTFHFDPAGIKPLDLSRAEANGITVDANNNDGQVLEAVLSDPAYDSAKPSFKAVLPNDVNRPAVGIATGVGRYDIDACTIPTPTNYEMIYDPSRSGQLEILRRPFAVKELTTGDTPVAQIYNDNVSGQVPERLRASLGNGKTDFAVELAKDPTMPEGSGLYNGWPLTPIPADHAGESNGVLLSGDSLVVSYTAILQKTAADTDQGFELGGKMEDTRPVVMRVILQVDGENSNYYLADSAPTNLTPTAVGLVLLRAVESIRIASVPPMTYTYGETLNQSFRLHFFIVMGSNSGKLEEGTFVWSEALCESRHMTVTWATKEQIENGEDGDIPYEAGQVFDMRYNGRFLSLSIPSDKKDEQGNTVIIRQHWPEPLVVKPRTLVLTAKVGQRFYGEETGADSLKFTYDPEQLLSRDKQALQEAHGSHYRLTGDGSELEGLAGYVAPTMGTAESVAGVTRVEDLADESICVPLTKYTKPLSGRRYAVYLSGAKSDNYQFQYTYEDAAGSKVVQDDWGASAYYVRPRLIVVESVKLPTGVDEPLDGVCIYSDTKSVSRKGDLTAEQVELSVPNTDPATGKVSYYALHGVKGESECSYADGSAATALVEGDDISLRYTATVVPDKTTWINMSDGYYTMDKENGKGYQMYPVQVSGLELVGDSVSNYTLVYKDEVASLHALPNQTVVLRERPVLGSPFLQNYHIPGTGTETDGEMAMAKVLLRPIVDVELTNLSKMNYTYGEFYNPSTLAYNRAPMQATLVYENDPAICNDDRTTVVETVSFGPVRYEDGQLVTTFDVRSLSIYWVADGQTVLQAVEAGQSLRYGQPVTEAIHNGKHLAMVSHRGDEPVCSGVSKETLSVKSKKLKLTALSQNRAYGEENKPFTFSLDLNELAEWDRDALTEEQKALAATDASAVLSALAAAKGYTYTQPTLRSSAGPGSDVLSGGAGSYPIELSGGGLSNYIIESEDGELHIYPRLIRIDHFNSAPSYPIYSIYANTNRRKFDTTVSNKGDHTQGQPSFTVTAASQRTYFVGDVQLTITGGADAAVYGDDELTLDIVVDFYSMTDDTVGEEERAYNVAVSEAKLAAGGKNGNYILEEAGIGTAAILDPYAIGVTQKRSIQSIRIMGLPRVTDYTYGEELDLRGLVVRITYQTGQGESVADQMRLVSFLSRDQFAAEGLYINYYDYPTVRESRPERDENGNMVETGNVESIFGGARRQDSQGNYYYPEGNYPSATTGDHLTIAPDHTKFKNRDFSANGKYLVISAQLNEGNPPVVPLLIPRVLNGSDAYRIVVDPLPLTFTVKAEDKTYDSNVQGAGTITFTNAFNQNGITDQIYPMTGASYENNWYSLGAGHTSFREYVTERGYSFTTGAYEPAGAPPLGINAPIDWGGMVGGRRYTYSYEGAQTNDYLRFRFTDPNVAYGITPTAHNYGTDADLAAMDVEVLGLRLAGPDARNYTLLGQSCDETASNVLTITAQSVAGMSAAVKATYQDARGTQAASGLPQAVIHKANRAALPSGDADVFPALEVDEHTNVVRLRYDQELSKVATRGDDEMEAGAAEGMALHFEYALQYFDGDGILCQWAGENGREFWWDETFFGGETDVKPQIPEGYIPKEDDLPTQEDLDGRGGLIKGQIYRWSEEDGGFVLDESAYPGGQAQIGYTLYTTSRTELPRDTVFYPVVRAAETWNYNASPAMSSTVAYTPWRIQQVLDAQAAVDNAATDEDLAAAQAELEAASAEARTALSAATDRAEEAVMAEKARVEAAGENGEWPEEGWPDIQSAMAVKTYPQRLEFISTSELESADLSMTERVQVPTLEAVWFTYMTEYPKKEYMDAAARNMENVRYRAYYWDGGHSAPIDFTGEDGGTAPLSLADVVRDILVEAPDEDGQDVETRVDVNLLHGAGPGHDARIYVRTSQTGGALPPVSIQIQPGHIYGAVGDEPQKLEVKVTPGHANNYVVLWSSSDETVVKVDEKGVVTFVGVGTATITAKALNNCVSTITVTVVEGWNSGYPKAIFDFGKLDEFFLLDAQGRFWPQRALTRGEAAVLLSRFYKSNSAWDKSGPTDFPDLTGEEYYAAAAREMGSVGVFLGMPDGTFAGEQIISRAEFVTLLVRMLGIDVPSTKGMPHAYLDTGELDTWAYANIDALSQRPGIIQGVGGGYFAPGRDITRAEAATLLERLLRYELDDSVKPMLLPTDVSDKSWAYRAILRGINQLLDV